MILAFSCGSPGTEQATVEADQAYDELRLFVTEQDLTDIEGRENYEDVEYEQLMAARAAEYERLLSLAERAVDPADEVRRQQLAELKSRYHTISDRYTADYLAYNRRRDIRQNLLGVSTERDDLSGITAAELPNKYQMFVNLVEENRPAYTEVDWDVVEGLWSALESRRQDLETNLSRTARNQIEQARNRFQSIREEMQAAVRATAVPQPE